MSFKAKTWLQTGVFLVLEGECACELNYIPTVLGKNTSCISSSGCLVLVTHQLVGLFYFSLLCYLFPHFKPEFSECGFTLIEIPCSSPIPQRALLLFLLVLDLFHLLHASWMAWSLESHIVLYWFRLRKFHLECLFLAFLFFCIPVMAFSEESHFFSFWYFMVGWGQTVKGLALHSEFLSVLR